MFWVLATDSVQMFECDYVTLYDEVWLGDECSRQADTYVCLRGRCVLLNVGFCVIPMRGDWRLS